MPSRHVRYPRAFEPHKLSFAIDFQQEINYSPVLLAAEQPPHCAKIAFFHGDKISFDVEEMILRD